LAGTPESFPVAQLALVGSCHWILNGNRVAARWGHRALPVGGAVGRWGYGLGCGAFALLNTMVTLTNGGKVVLAWLVTRAKMRDVARVLALGAFVLALGVAFFALRAHVNGRDWMDGIRATLVWIPEERNLPRELYGFFIRPVGLYQSFVV
ncbi:MAG: nitronate monooxygenase, partial [Kiritimatiellae bacterium]|nr:nitronate monooxygenase [Kiritimatiellia bacterium]